MRLNLPPVTLNILIINGIVFLLLFISLRVYPDGTNPVQVAGRPLVEYFSIYPAGDLFGMREVVYKKQVNAYCNEFAAEGIERQMCVKNSMAQLPGAVDKFHPVQVVTALFSHDPNGIFHLVFDCLALVFLGGFLERTIGGKRFLAFYLFSGIMSNILISVFSPGLSPGLGSSTALFGAMVYVAVLNPNMPVSFFFLPAIPIRIMCFIAEAASILLLFLRHVAGIDPVPFGHFGHLMGMATALLWIYPLAPLRNKLKI